MGFITKPTTARLRRLQHTLASVAAIAGLSLGLAADAQASGLSTARFGGEHGHPTTDNATAVYYNPAALGFSKGTHFFVDGSLALRWSSYTRPESALSATGPGGGTPEDAVSANSGRASLFNPIAAPMAAVSSDFGTKFMTAGAGFYVPFGGAAVWNQNPDYENSREYPGAKDGVQRWYTIDGSLRSMYFTGALAFNIEKIGLSLGLSGSAIRSNVDTIRARNTDGTDHVVDAMGRLKEGRSLVNVKGWQGGFGVGVGWRLRDLLWIGASYTSQPNVAGGMRLKGVLTNVLTTQDREDTDVILTQTLPEIIRLGVRVRPIKKLELRLFGDYTRWSVMDKQCVFPQGIEGDPCDEFTNTDTALTDPANFGGEPDLDDGVSITQHLPRFWKDAGGVRVGASYWIIPQVEAYIGAGYDSSAVPAETIEPALMDANKVTASLGVRAQIIKNFALALTLTDIIYLPVDTDGSNVLNDFQAPTKQADANGVYKQNIGLLNVYVDVSF